MTPEGQSVSSALRAWETRIREVAERIGRIEARAGAGSGEHEAALREWDDIREDMSAISGDVRGVLDTILDVEDEYGLPK